MERARRIFTLLTPGKSWERGLIAALALLLLPVASLLVQGLRGSEGGLGLEFVGLFLANPLYAEGLLNSLLAGAGAALLAGALALPIAGVLWRCNVRPSPFLELCGFLPLFVPPFVLAASLQAENIVFTGRIQTTDYIGKMDMTLLTSISEGPSTAWR